MGTSDDPENTLDTLTRHLAQAKTAHQRVKTTAKDLRSNFLTNLVDELALDRNVKHGTALKQIIHAENSARLHKQITRKMKGSRKGMLTELLVPCPSSVHPNARIRITDPELIHTILISTNTAKLSKLDISSFAYRTLYDDLGKYGNKTAVDEILCSNYNTAKLSNEYGTLSELLIDFIKELKVDPATKVMQWNYRVPEYKQSFSKAMESTAVDTSNLHMGVWKAACKHDGVAAVNATFIAFTMRYRHSLKRWAKFLHCMLQKQQNPYVTALRIIQLFELDLNRAVKLLMGRYHVRHEYDNELNKPLGDNPERCTRRT